MARFVILFAIVCSCIALALADKACEDRLGCSKKPVEPMCAHHRNDHKTFYNRCAFDCGKDDEGPKYWNYDYEGTCLEVHPPDHVHE